MIRDLLEIGVGIGCDHDQFVIEQFLNHKTRSHLRRVGQGHLNNALDEKSRQTIGHTDLGAQAEVRQVFAQRIQPPKPKPRPERILCADHKALRKPLRNSDLLTRFFPELDHREGIGLELTPCGSEFRPGFGAGKQRSPKAVFKSLNTEADSRLGHEQTV